MFDPANPQPLKESRLERAFVRFSYWPVYKVFGMVFLFCLILVFVVIAIIELLQIPVQFQDLITNGITILILAMMLTAFCRLCLKTFQDNLLRYVSGPDVLSTMTARGLEHLCIALYRARGYRVKHRAVWGKPDGGVDLEIFRDGRRGLVQCKKWTHDNVGVDKVRELMGVMTTKQADFGVIVTTSGFTEPAEIAAARGKVELVNHARLWEMVQESRLEDIVAQNQRRITTTQIGSANTAPLRVKRKEPLRCPECGSGLVLREKNGLFLGCKGYGSETKCGFTVPVEDGRRG